jgi:hypothetical protein
LAWRNSGQALAGTPNLLDQQQNRCDYELAVLKNSFQGRISQVCGSSLHLASASTRGPRRANNEMTWRDIIRQLRNERQPPVGDLAGSISSLVASDFSEIFSTRPITSISKTGIYSQTRWWPVPNVFVHYQVHQLAKIHEGIERSNHLRRVRSRLRVSYSGTSSLSSTLPSSLYNFRTVWL